MITWLTLDKFNALEKEKSAIQSFVEETVSLSLSDEFFEKRIPMEPYLSQDEEYGATKTWFGEVNSELFVIMCHPEAQRPLTIVGAEGHHILAELKEFGYQLFSGVKWVRGNIFDATTSVFMKDDLGVEVEVFRAKSITDAETMAAFLNINGKTVQYYTKTSDNLNTQWGVYEKFSEKLVGKSHDRASAEYFGIEYTKKNSVPTFVAPMEKNG